MASDKQPETGLVAIQTSEQCSEDNDLEDQPRTRSRWRRVLGLFWDSFDGTPEERTYVQKLDRYMFTYMLLAYLLKQLDQTNLSNAYVSGLADSLHLHGNQRNYLNTCFNIGILLGTIPAQIIQLQHIRPSVWIPSCEIFWSLLVLGMGFARNVETLYVLRFLVGFAAACVFPGFAALLGGWYGPGQLAKRAAVFEQASAVGNMVSGYLQAAVYKGLDGSLGLGGWQWMFIVDGLIGLPIAAWGLFAVPDLPHTTRAFYFSEEERHYGIHRVEKFGRRAPRKLTLAELGKVFANWRLWLFVLLYLMVGQAISGISYFNLYLRAAGYTIVETNILPTAGDALSVVAALAFGIVADLSGRSAIMIIGIEILVIVSNIILSVWDVSRAGLLFAFYLSYAGLAAQPIVIAWGNHLMAGDPTLRQMLVACGNVASYTVNAWLPLVAFPTYDAPEYDYGYQILAMFGGLAIVSAVAMQGLRARF